MSAPFRITRPDAAKAQAVTAAGGEETFKFYLDRLLKMIPAEVIGLYLVGSGVIPHDQTAGLAIWAVVCLIGLFAVRIYGTSDPAASLPPDWTHIIISAVAFVIWVYSLGGPFQDAGLYVPWIGSLAILAWTFFVPIFYQGPAQ